jgi:type III pantothenate kinase
MLLTIDIGNTNLTLGLYEGDKLGAHWRLATDHNRMPDEYGLQFLGLLQNAAKHWTRSRVFRLHPLFRH